MRSGDGGRQSGRKEVRERPFFVSPSESRTTIQVNRQLHLKSTANLTSSQVATSLQVKLELHFNRRSDFTSSERKSPLWRYVLGALRGICLEVIVRGFRFFAAGEAAPSRRSRRSREQAPGGLSPPRWWRHPKDHGGCSQKTRVVARKRPWWLRAKDHGGCAQKTMVVARQPPWWLDANHPGGFTPTTLVVEGTPPGPFIVAKFLSPVALGFLQIQWPRGSAALWFLRQDCRISRIYRIILNLDNPVSSQRQEVRKA